MDHAVFKLQTHHTCLYLFTRRRHTRLLCTRFKPAYTCQINDYDNDDGGGNTHNDKRDEVDPVPERMRILYVIHDVDPAFETYHLQTNQTTM